MGTKIFSLNLNFGVFGNLSLNSFAEKHIPIADIYCFQRVEFSQIDLLKDMLKVDHAWFSPTIINQKDGKVGNLTLSKKICLNSQDIVFPGYEKTENSSKFQGAGGISTTFYRDSNSEFNILNVLPCFNEDPFNNKSWIEMLNYLFEFGKNQKTIVCGDFHNSPDIDWWKEVNQNSFKDVFYQHHGYHVPTWISEDGNQKLDYVFCNSDIIKDIEIVKYNWIHAHSAYIFSV